MLWQCWLPFCPQNWTEIISAAMSFNTSLSTLSSTLSRFSFAFSCSSSAVKERAPPSHDRRPCDVFKAVKIQRNVACHPSTAALIRSKRCHSFSWSRPGGIRVWWRAHRRGKRPSVMQRKRAISVHQLNGLPIATHLPRELSPVRWRLCGWFWDKRHTKVNKLLCRSGPLLA